jgi:hypothetical protein
MKKKIVFILLLCGAVTSLTYAQKQVRIEYDAAGNVVKASPSMELERATIDGQYSIKVYPSPTTGPLKIQVYDEQTGQAVSCPIRLRVTNVAGNSTSVIDRTFPNGNITIDLSSAPNGIYGLSFLVQVSPQSTISNNSIKIVKKS